MARDDFLPLEYVEHRADRRTHRIGLVLFAIVVAGVGIAFLVQQSNWAHVRQLRDTIAVRYEEAGERVEAVSRLEARQQLILDRASVAASLVERLPRSTLLSEFINRMPTGVGLLEFDLHARAIKSESASEPSGRGTRACPVEDLPAVAPRYRTDISLLGFAPTDIQVSGFLAAINKHPMFNHVVLQFSEETEMEGRIVRQFRMTCALGPDADLRTPSALLDQSADGPRDVAVGGGL